MIPYEYKVYQPNTLLLLDINQLTGSIGVQIGLHKENFYMYRIYDEIP
jgi:hypothetical protein